MTRASFKSIEKQEPVVERAGGGLIAFTSGLNAKAPETASCGTELAVDGAFSFWKSEPDGRPRGVTFAGIFHLIAKGIAEATSNGQLRAGAEGRLAFT